MYPEDVIGWSLTHQRSDWEHLLGHSSSFLLPSVTSPGCSAAQRTGETLFNGTSFTVLKHLKQAQLWQTFNERLFGLQSFLQSSNHDIRLRKPQPSGRTLFYSRPQRCSFNDETKEKTALFCFIGTLMKVISDTYIYILFFCAKTLNWQQ